LARLLAKAPCRFETVDARTVRILPLTAAAAPAAPSAPRVQTAPARAASPPAPPAPVREDSPMAEIVVTATKRSAPLGTTPAAVSVIGGQTLADNGTRHTTSVAGQMASVIVTNLGPGRDKILLRGLSDGAFTGRARSTVGTYLDDTPITYNAPDPDLRLTDVERIEVVRGPQGALYGGGSLAGVFRIVTKAPDLNDRTAAIDISRGYTQSGSASNAWDVMGNLPLIQDKAAVRLVAYHALDGGYVDDVNLRLSNVDSTTRAGGRVALLLRPTEAWSISVNSAIQQLESNDTQYATVNRLQRANKVRETHKNDFAETGLSVSHAGEAVRLQSSTSYIRHDFSSLYDASAALPSFGSSEADLGLYREGAKISMLVQDLFAASKTPGRFDWLAGAYASRTLEATPAILRAVGGPARSPAPPSTVYAEERSDRLLETALYGALSYDLTTRLTASIGGRLFQTRLLTRSEVVVPSPGVTRPFVGKDRFRGVSPKLSLQYRLDDGGLIYGSISQGYRAGGFNTAGRLPPADARAGYRPDRLVNYEVGAKMTRLDGRIDLRTALFYARWSNIQADQYFPSGLAYTTNVGDGRNLGLEGEATYLPTPRITLQAHALLNSPRISHVDPAFASQVQDGLPGIPEFSFGAQAHYRQPLGDEADLLFGAQVSYVGKSHLTFEPGTASDMGDIVAARLSAAYQTRRWSLALFLTNPANTAGDTFAYGNPFSFGQVRQVTPQRPRTATVELSATF
jgi:outer membrane receptor protein involved in Fe transport